MEYIIGFFILFIILTIISTKESISKNNNQNYEVSSSEEIITEIGNDMIYHENQNNLSIFNEIIPEYIRKLLWFTNGPYENYSDSEPYYKFTVNGVEFTINFNYINKKEPSCIDFSLPIIKPTTNIEVGKIGYYPSYESLDPTERYIYLNWLKNPFNSIDLGYVYIFYYGLERHLLLGNFDDSYDMILNLLKSHKLSYAHNALVFSAILKKRNDKLMQYLTDFPDSKELSLHLKLILYSALKIPLTADEIINYSRQVEFTNTRYIKGNKELFIEKLKKVIYDNKSSYEINLNDYFMNYKRTTELLIFANYSFSYEDRMIKVPDLLNGSQLSTDLNKFLIAAHELVKEELKLQRKASKNIK